MNFVGIIPARYASTRFPGKPLAKLGGKTVIERVYRQVSKVLDYVYVATDSEQIFNTVISFGGNAIMTSPNHKSGTDRVEEAVNKTGKKFDVVINIQGDEPFIHESQIKTICECFDDSQTMIATLGRPFSNNDTIAELENPNSPKIVCDNNNFAMYFSRSIIPYIRNVEKQEWLNSFNYLKHIGLYAYRRNVLSEITQLKQSSLEIAESLEQLRWLQNGYKIKVGITEIETIGIDTPEDLQKAEEFLNKNR
ncbi:3-deoxy-manno-octulosonate cytidylyltransferase [Marseilla massiliensis]|uniref:3-deoxy-manno-octulosonate cytidylyltransferase n=1 Tax=Marseilla massiliensis TaxID=1841864 RepID=A0A939B7Z6_9BACT|nr:3-deoxy-manno-octulosonate cytidylyltransferase [Marseilla massiliensis]MBM6674052.1 3-deoxy-manno-octulosonate cytidylyltransferase [Marseilla massiliensis]